MPILECSNISAAYGKHVALDKVSFRLEPGRVLAVLGPNGSGKTTLFRLLLGFKSPTAGTVSIMGGAPGAGPVLERLGATLESPSYYGHLTGFENLQSTAYLKGMRGKGMRDRLMAVLGDVGLSDAWNKASASYSLGMLQRLALAQAIVGDPDLLIFDEPTNGLDPDGVLWIREWVRNRARTHRQTIVLATHMLYEAAKVADDLLILREGASVFHGTLADLYGKNADSVRIRVDDRPLAAKVLSEIGIATEVGANGELIADAPASACPAIAKHLVGQGVGILDLGVRQPSLESKYLDLMEVR